MAIVEINISIPCYKIVSAVYESEAGNLNVSAFLVDCLSASNVKNDSIKRYVEVYLNGSHRLHSGR